MYFYDIETMINFFSVIFIDTNKNKKIFYIYKNHNDLEELLSFVSTKPTLVGFNNINFDAQVIQFLWNNQKRLKSLSGEELIDEIYLFAQSLINRPKDTYLPFSVKEFICFNIDLFKMLHLDGKAKSASLKWCEFSMDWENLQDMPIRHDTYITEEQIASILDYNLNDVLATMELFNRHLPELKLRKELTKQFGIDLLSASEPRIAKEIFAKYLTESMQISPKELKQMRTFRNRIDVKNIILPAIKFQTKPFQQLLSYFNSQVLRPDDVEELEYDSDGQEISPKVKYSILHQGCKLDYALGGVHGFATSPTIYEETEDVEILSFDVTSFYPFFNFITGKCPEHIPKDVFNPLYRSFFDKRKVIPKKDPMNYVFKIILNSSYGLTKDKHSYLYDPEYTMSVTINCQLFISMLIEKLTSFCTVIMANTDGAEMLVKKKDKERYFQICKEWEEETGFELEYCQYKKLIGRDVNSYCAIYDNGSVKLKGAFEYENLPVYKNKSMSIVPKAIYNHFINNIPVEKTIMECKNIFEFCKGEKGKGDNKYFLIDKKTGEEKPCQKTNRYFVSNDGNFFVKRMPPLENKTPMMQLDIFGDVDDGTRESQVEAGSLTTIYNKHINNNNFSNYNINYNYYINECNKIIDVFKKQ